MGKRKFDNSDPDFKAEKPKFSASNTSKTGKSLVKMAKKAAYGRRLKELLDNPDQASQKRGRSETRVSSDKKQRNGSQDQGERLESSVHRLTGTRKAVAESNRKADERQTIIHESKSIWEKMRTKNVPETARNEMLGQLWSQVTGNIMEIIHKHDTSRVIQTLLKCLTSNKSNTVETTDKTGNQITMTCDQIFESFFEEIGPNLPVLSKELYAHHVVERSLHALAAHCSKKKELFASYLLKLERYFGGKLSDLSTHIIASKIVEKLFHDFDSPFIKAELLFGHSRKALYVEGSKDYLTLIPATILPNVLDRLKNLIDKMINKSDLLALPYCQFAISFYLDLCVSARDGVRIGFLLPQLAEHALDFLLSASVYGSKIFSACANFSNAKLRKQMLKSVKGHTSTILNLTESHSTVALMRLILLTDDTNTSFKMILQELVFSNDDLAAIEEGVQYTATGEAAGFNYPAMVWLLCCPTSSDVSSAATSLLMTNQPPSARGCYNASKFLLHLLFSDDSLVLLEDFERIELDMSSVIVNLPEETAVEESKSDKKKKKKMKEVESNPEGEDEGGDGAIVVVNQPSSITWPHVQSKKDLEAKRAELYQLMAPTMEVLCCEFCHVLLRSGFGSKIVEAYVKKSKSNAVLDAIVSALMTSEEAPVEGKKELALVEHPIGHLVIRHVLKYESTQEEADDVPSLGKKLTEALQSASVDVLCKWLCLTRPSFILLDLMARHLNTMRPLVTKARAKNKKAKVSAEGAGAIHIFTLIDGASK